MQGITYSLTVYNSIYDHKLAAGKDTCNVRYKAIWVTVK